jgi:GNAT superfamily N-acetyltransferase
MNWELRGRLISVRNGSKAYVAIARKHNLPVAVVLVRLTRDGQSPYDIAAYCKDAFRRQGISTQLINALKAEAAPLPEARTGINGSHTFWIKNGIDCIPTYWD